MKKPRFGKKVKKLSIVFKTGKGIKTRKHGNYMQNPDTDKSSTTFYPTRHKK